jgi:hypothetical protein
VGAGAWELDLRFEAPFEGRELSSFWHPLERANKAPAAIAPILIQIRFIMTGSGAKAGPGRRRSLEPWKAPFEVAEVVGL